MSVIKLEVEKKILTGAIEGDDVTSLINNIVEKFHIDPQRALGGIENCLTKGFIDAYIYEDGDETRTLKAEELKIELKRAPFGVFLAYNDETIRQLNSLAA